MFAHIFYSQFSSIKRFSIKRKVIVHCWSIRLSVRWPLVCLYLFLASLITTKKKQMDQMRNLWLVGPYINDRNYDRIINNDKLKF